MDNKKSSTIEDDSPVFKSWNTWYLIVILTNVALVAAIYLYFKFI